jgi:glycogen debranching enzyme
VAAAPPSRGGEDSPLADYRDQVPDLIPYLLPGQRVIKVEHSWVAPPPRRHPSALRALMRLTAADRLADIGAHGPCLAALARPENEQVEGLRLFEGVFGRDALYMGLALYDRYPQLLEPTLLRFAELQGVRTSPASEEEPGRIVHWVLDADDPIARNITALNQWDWPHYGTVDATPMFISGIALVAARKQDFLRTPYISREGRKCTMWQSFSAALAWLEQRLDANPDGLLEFWMQQPRGISNQAWKDTPESYMRADGSYANHKQGIASVEVQALAYDALIDAAALCRSAAGTPDSEQEPASLLRAASRYIERAEQIRGAVLEEFWLEDERGGYLALGTERNETGSLRPLAVRTSNMGHVLNSRLLEHADRKTAARVKALIRTLFSAEMLAPAGIRTLSCRGRRFLPGAYHCGSVWLWDNRHISRGLDRHGYHGLAADLDRRVFQVGNDSRIFPEFVRGGGKGEPLLNERIVELWERRDHYSSVYRVERLAQEIQAWSVEAILSVKRRLNPLRPAPAAASDPAKRKLETDILSGIDLRPDAIRHLR